MLNTRSSRRFSSVYDIRGPQLCRHSSSAGECTVVVVVCNTYTTYRRVIMGGHLGVFSEFSLVSSET